MKTSKKSAAARSLDHSRNGSPTREEIALCAHQIWEQAGRPDGRDMEHWLQAEAQLRKSRSFQALSA
jgi:hypothetical protein